MKSTGIVRRIDELGRVVLPKEIRDVLDIKERDAIEIFTDGDKIILTKYHPGCIFCGSADDVVFFGNKRICHACVSKLKDQL